MPQKFEKILFWHYWVKTAVLPKRSSYSTQRCLTSASLIIILLEQITWSSNSSSCCVMKQQQQHDPDWSEVDFPGCFFFQILWPFHNIWTLTRSTMNLRKTTKKWRMKSNFLVPFSLACCWAFSKFSHKPSPENREAIFLNSVVVALIMYGQISTLLHIYRATWPSTNWWALSQVERIN